LSFSGGYPLFVSMVLEGRTRPARVQNCCTWLVIANALSGSFGITNCEICFVLALCASRLFSATPAAAIRIPKTSNARVTAMTMFHFRADVGRPQGLEMVIVS
jgi:hypothetical protein